jgi:hypothetical protein
MDARHNLDNRTHLLYCIEAVPLDTFKYNGQRWRTYALKCESDRWLVSQPVRYRPLGRALLAPLVVDHGDVVSEDTRGAVGDGGVVLGRDDDGLRHSFGALLGPVVDDAATGLRQGHPNDLRHLGEDPEVILADVAGVITLVGGDGPGPVHNLTRAEEELCTVGEDDLSICDLLNVDAAPDDEVISSCLILDTNDNHYTISNLVGRYVLYYTLISP